VVNICQHKMKFGNHISFIAQSKEVGDNYIVPFYTLANIISHPTSSAPPANQGSNGCLSSFGRRSFKSKVRLSLTTAEKFTAAWREALTSASTSFTSSTRTSWRAVYSGISTISDTRGVPLETAVRLYAHEVGLDGATDLLVTLKAVQKAAQLNAEALRKLLKKYDKLVESAGDNERLTELLMPELYASMVAVGQATLEIAIETIRCSIEDMELAENDGADQPYQIEIDRDDRPPLTNECSKSLISEMNTVARRADETEWLNSFSRQIPDELLSATVGHRGFHDPCGRTDLRPIENSLAAFEAAWSAGVPHCECDVALTKDEKIVLAHDEDFTRLALDSCRNNLAGEKVRDLTLKQLIGLSLRNGVRAPLLVDVLRSAAMIGGDARLVIEIKPGNTEVGIAVARFLVQYPELMERVSAIITFDLYCLHQIRDEFTRAADLDVTGASVRGGMRMSMTSLGVSRSSMMASPSTRALSINGSLDPGNGFLPGNSLALNKVNPVFTLSENSIQENKEDQPALKNTKLITPELLLLTVTSAPEDPAELFMDILDVSSVKGWLNNPNGNLDGMYIRYQEKMKEPEGATALRALTARCAVGIWLLFEKDPDNYETMKYLVEECGVSYFNTDLPKDFF